MYDLAEEKGKHVHFDWQGEEPPSNMHDVRAAAAPFALRLKWTTLFSFRFFAGKHINGERDPASSGALVDSRVVLGVVSKGRSKLTKN